MRRPLIASRKKHLHNGRHREQNTSHSPKHLKNVTPDTRKILVEFVDTTDFNNLKDVRVMTNRKYSYALKKKKNKSLQKKTLKNRNG